MNIIKTSLFALLLSLLAQTESAFAQEQWIATETANTYGSGVLLAAESDGGGFVLSKDNFKLTRFDRCGVALWNRSIAPGADNAQAVHMISREGGGVVALFRLVQASRYISLMVAFDAQGSVLWSKTLDDPAHNYIPYSLGSDTDGRIHVFGSNTEIATNAVWLFISSFDPQGSLRWSKLIGDGFIWGGALSTSDGGFLLRSGNRLVKLNGSGAYEWGQSYLWGAYDYQSPIETSSGYLMSGYQLADQDVAWLEVNFNGQPKTNGLHTIDLKSQSPRLVIRNQSIVMGFTETLPSGSRWVQFALNDRFEPVAGSAWVPQQGVVHQSPDELMISTEGQIIAAGTRGGNLVIAQTGVEQNSAANCTFPISSPGHSLSQVSTLDWNPGITATTLPWTSIAVSPGFGTVQPQELCRWEPKLALGPDTAFCGSGRLILGDRDRDEFDRYRWSTGATTPEIEVDRSGVYWLEVFSECGGSVQIDTLLVEILPFVPLDLPAQFALCPEERLRIEAPECTSCEYFWSTGSRDPSIEPRDTGSFWLEVSSDNGCKSLDTFQVVDAQCHCAVYMADAFSPNEDDLNETYGPVLDCRWIKYRFEVYDRWGKMLYASLNPEFEWDGTVDGTPCLPGVYFYRVSLKAEIRAQEVELDDKRGTLMLFR